MLIGRREEWIKKFATHLRPMFEELGCVLPNKIIYTLSLPPELPNGSRLTSNELENTLGLCSFHQDTCYIYIHTMCPVPDIAPVLVHELCHACLPNNGGHKGSFAKLAKKVGLVGNLIYSTPGEQLLNKLNNIESRIGRCPPLNCRIHRNYD